jgi:glycosyltransferase involved in cell wall biosynthesis
MTTALDQLAGLHVLFLNWRDPAHPQAGGAERYCHEIARRWAASGAKMTLFASRYPGASPRASFDGVSVRRAGGSLAVYPAAALHLRRNLHEYDALVDFQNGIPFFSPLFAGRWTASVCVIHHVHQEQFDLRFNWPLNTVGRVLEKQFSRVVYRGRPIVVVSPSTRYEVRRSLGFHNPIYLVPNGAPPPAAIRPPRSATPTIVVVNRLVAHKRIDLLLRAIPALLHRWPQLHVDIAGDGTELPRLVKLATTLRVNGSVQFHGYVDERRKHELLARAWLTVVPSRAEGWGLAVTEANSVGTPALAFDVPGLRDAIRPGSNGWLLRPETDLADGIEEALVELSVVGVQEKMADRCLAWSSVFSWDDSAVRLAEVVLAESRRVQRRRRSRRKTSDLAVIAQFNGADGHAMERVIRGSLRRTDACIRTEDGFWLVLHGCDEVLALKVLRRLGVTDAAVTLARRSDFIHRPESDFAHSAKQPSTWPSLAKLA